MSDLMKLLDNGQTVILRRNTLGTYFGVAVKRDTEAGVLVRDAVDTAVGWDGVEFADGSRDYGECMAGVVETDDRTPDRLLYRLTEKATTGRIAGQPLPEPEKKTFEEWCGTCGFTISEGPVKDVARAAWEAGSKHKGDES